MTRIPAAETANTVLVLAMEATRAEERRLDIGPLNLALSFNKFSLNSGGTGT